MQHNPYIKLEEIAGNCLIITLMDKFNNLLQVMFIKGEMLCQSEIAIIVHDISIDRYIYVTDNGFTICKMPPQLSPDHYVLDDRDLNYDKFKFRPFYDKLRYLWGNDVVDMGSWTRLMTSVNSFMVSGKPIVYNFDIPREFEFTIKNKIIYNYVQFNWQHFVHILQFIDKKMIIMLIHLFRQLNTLYRDALRYLIVNIICDFPI